MTELRYIVRGKVAKTPEHLDSIKAGDTVWLGYTREAGGWYEWYKAKEWAKPFETEEAARHAAKICNGPWYSLPSPESIELLEVDYTPAQEAKYEIRQQHHI